MILYLKLSLKKIKSNIKSNQAIYRLMQHFLFCVIYCSLVKSLYTQWNKNCPKFNNIMHIIVINGNEYIWNPLYIIYP